MRVCQGKISFSSYRLANKARRRHNDEALTIFYCEQCHGFHLGTRAPRQALENRKKQRILELSEAEQYENESRN